MTLAELQSSARLRLPAEHRGPVLLEPYLQEVNISHDEIPALTLGRIVGTLLKDDIILDVPEADHPTPLEGFLFRFGRSARAFINADQIVTRRRFTVAHELGHFVLHSATMKGNFQDIKIHEKGDAVDQMEREADQFAAELLMPEAMVRYRAKLLTETHGAAPRAVLVARLASEFLVSREAMRYRLTALGVGDE
jgi:IrrE N-terminal-like domain